MSEEIHDIDSNLRIELLERNLSYIQQQYETTIIDLRNEINRLQQENKGIQIKNKGCLKELFKYLELRDQLINNLSSKQQLINTDQLSSSTPEKFIDGNK